MVAGQGLRCRRQQLSASVASVALPVGIKVFVVESSAGWSGRDLVLNGGIVLALRLRCE